MLKINKKTTLINVNYSIQFLLGSKQLNNKLKIIKNKNSMIFVRAPKNFNIGKQKIINLNYKIYKLNYKKHIICHLFLFLQKKNLFNKLKKNLKINTFFICKSVKCTIKTKFTIKWLEL